MFRRPSIDEYERQQAQRLEAERQREAARCAEVDRRDAERRATREQQLQEATTSLLGMTPSEHLARAAELDARGGQANAVVHLLFAIAKGNIQ